MPLILTDKEVQQIQEGMRTVQQGLDYQKMVLELAILDNESEPDEPVTFTPCLVLTAEAIDNIYGAQYVNTHPFSCAQTIAEEWCSFLTNADITIHRIRIVNQ